MRSGCCSMDRTCAIALDGWQKAARRHFQAGRSLSSTVARDRCNIRCSLPTRWRASLGRSWPKEDTIERRSLLQPPEEAWQWEREATAEQDNRICEGDDGVMRNSRAVD